MILLHARLGKRCEAEPFIARVVRGSAARFPSCEREALFVGQGQALIPGYRAYLLGRKADDSLHSENPAVWPIPESLCHLSDGDIIRISPRSGELWVMYRRQSAFNSMLLTEQCNSYCLMCSQPPKASDDRHLIRAYLDAIPLMAVETRELGITGGEPTLLGERLLEVIRRCRDCLPTTAVHMLSNGRLFNYLSLCRGIAAIEHPDLMIGIPLYADIAHRHDFVVQADGAFDQTIRGIMNLARCGISVEIRTVLHRETVDRLPQFARFIARNLPFVDHVALMGLEMMGFVRMNLDALWIDPVEYQTQLRDAALHLQQHGLNVSIYNHQLCVLHPELWPIARKSISDWKNEYLDECNGCSVQDQCGGFFASSSVRHSDHIRRLNSEMLASDSCMIPTRTFTV
jgi:His-Xaa-Ser system radical SAM maturase HxsC